MTFSLLARDPLNGAIGIALASRFFAVGAICPFVFAGRGALITQASGHPPFGPRADALFRDGADADRVVATLTADDEHRESRQLLAVDSQGRFAVHTGGSCVSVAGSRVGSRGAIAGNMLASERVLDAGLAGLEANLPLAPRLLAGLASAHAAGGDRRGQQAAAILIYGAADYPLLSLRVDDDPDAVLRLGRLYADAAVDYIPYIRGLASADEAGAVFG